MLYDERAVRDNIRNREGRRVFFLGKEDRLTPSARDWLARERIPILSGEEAAISRYRLLGGGFCTEKPEHMTHLHGDVLVPKTHPRIAFRGAMDTLEAELILCRLHTGLAPVQEVLDLARKLIRCEVLEEPLDSFTLGGLTESQQRKQSQFPQAHFGIAHFMPEAEDGEKIAWLNRSRCAARAAELAACRAFAGPDGVLTRPDLVQALNRMSSFLYILMLKEKAKAMDNG